MISEPMWPRRLGIVALAVAAVTVATSAAAVTGGPEFQVNTYTAYNQEEPAVSSAADGRFIVVWRSFYQDDPASGQAAVVAQRFDSLGAPLGTEFVVNTYTTANQREGAVAMTSDGRFLVVWNSDGQGHGVLRLYLADGSPQTGEIDFPNYISNATTVALPNGSFVVVWETANGADGDNAGVSARMVDAAGNPTGSEFQVNTYTTDRQERPSVAAADGGFVISWESTGQDGSGRGIFGQRFDSAGAAVGTEFQVNTYTTGFQTRSSVAGLAGGGFVVVWDGDLTTDNDAVLGQRFGSDGAPLGTELHVNVFTTGEQYEPRVAATPDGGFVVAWTSDDYYGPFDEDGDRSGVFVRRFDANGDPVSGDFQANVYTTYDQNQPAVAPVGDGFAVVWRGQGQDDPAASSGQGIFGRVLDGAVTTTTSSTTTTTLPVITTTTTTASTLPPTTMVTLPTTTLSVMSTTTSTTSTSTTTSTTVASPTTTSTTTTLPVITTTTTLETSTTLPATTTTLPVTTTLATTTTTSTSTTTLPSAACGDPVVISTAFAGLATGSRLITATDALFVLKAAVGLETCDPCVCDTSGDGSISASDALITLRVAVGIAQELSCPPCGV